MRDNQREVRPHLQAAGALVACTAALAVAACGGGDEPERPADAPARASARPALCSDLRARVTGTVSSPEATELSGLALSHEQRGVLWTHNDSGDGARLFAVNARGRLLAEVAVAGAQAVDWEDVAVGPAPGGRDAVYAADIGDNDAARPNVVVYRVAEPRLRGAGRGITAAARPLALRYPDGAHDAEALLVSPSSGALFIVTKDFSGRARVYVSARPERDGHPDAQARGPDRAGRGRGGHGGGHLGRRPDDRPAQLLPRVCLEAPPRGESIAAALRRKPCVARADLFDEGQGEALALTRDGGAFYTVPEGGQPPIRRYAPR